MKILITGGCGFLGSHLAMGAGKRGHEVFLFDNFSRTGGQDNYQYLKQHIRFDLKTGDIRNRDDIDSYISEIQPDVIFHVAGQVAMTTSLKSPRQDFEINTLGTFNVLESIKRVNPKAVMIYSSTNKVYGDLLDLHYEQKETRHTLAQFPNGLPESLPLDFSTPYGCSKGAADQYVRDAFRSFGLRTVVFRHSSIFGPQQYGTVDQGWVSWFVSQALEQKRNPNHRFTISGDGLQVRDILSAQDLIHCYFSALEHIDRTQGQVYNIGGGQENSFSLIELFSLLEKHLDMNITFDRLPARQSDQKVFIADIAKAKKDFDWRPLVHAENAIKEMIDWSRSIQ
jgi:CDP-paratose 2-epimerase